VLVTGGLGLIGSRLEQRARREGWQTRVLDLRAPQEVGRGDTRIARDVERALDGCTGIVHLAAVSRVISAERDPALCWATNVDGTRTVLEAAQASPNRPWVLFASSREVYGEPPSLPVSEETVLAPVNIYGRSKVAGEELVLSARDQGLCTAVVRLSNVYGSVDDHEDRVVPAFVRASIDNHDLRVDGGENMFDFTHVDDVTGGLLAAMRALEAGSSLLPIHFVSGHGTTLGALASLVVELARSRSKIVEAPSRSFDVPRFFGDTHRAANMLGWRSVITLRDGVARLIAEHRALRGDQASAL